jgi:hypothetical protein
MGFFAGDGKPGLPQQLRMPMRQFDKLPPIQKPT